SGWLVVDHGRERAGLGDVLPGDIALVLAAGRRLARADGTASQPRVRQLREGHRIWHRDQPRLVPVPPRHLIARLSGSWRPTVGRFWGVPARKISTAVNVHALQPDRDAGHRSDQDVRFCRGLDDVRLAWAIHGSGPPIIVVSCWLSHLQHDWRSPVWRHFLRDLGEIATVVRYDERGFGMSDWNVSDFSLEARHRDLEALV